MIQIALTGDVMLGRGVDETLADQPPEWPWGDLLEPLRSADLLLINLECPIAASGSPWRETPRVFHFRAGPHAIPALRAAGVDCVNLANNHALDYGRQALVETLDRLDEAGIAHVGAGRDREEAERPVVLERGELKVGILGACDDPVEYAAGRGSPGTHRIGIDADGRARIESLVRDLRDACDLVVLTVHWGPNMRLEPPDAFRSFARHLIDAGVAIYHGHSAHVFQGVEWRDSGLVLYDTGDFLDDYAVDPSLRNDWGLLYRAALSAGGAERLEVSPIYLEYAQTRHARGDEVEAIRDRLERLCRPFGSRVRGEGPPWRIVGEPPG